MKNVYPSSVMFSCVASELEIAFLPKVAVSLIHRPVVVSYAVVHKCITVER
jgi:hypothetical protein